MNTDFFPVRFNRKLPARSPPDFIQDVWILDFPVTRQQEYLRHHFRSLRVVVGEQQEQSSALLAFFRGEIAAIANHQQSTMTLSTPPFRAWDGAQKL